MAFLLFSSSSAQWAYLGVLLGLTALLYTLTLATYRLLFHPLAHHPGPLLGRLTDWYSVHRAWTGTRHLDFERLHRTYGPIVRYGPHRLSFNTATALHGIYGSKAHVRKADFYSVFPARPGAWSTHSAIDKGLHARKRRVLSQAFSDGAMRGLQPHILEGVRRFGEALGTGAGEGEEGEEGEKGKGGWSVPRNMAEWTNYMSYDVLGDICYGKSFGTLERAENRFAVELVGTSSKFHYLNAQMPALKKLGLDRLLFPKLRADRERFMAYSKGRLAERMNLGTDTDRRDFFYYLLKAKDPETGKGFAMQELWGESNVLLIAGSDTTSTALSACFHYLLYNPTHLSLLTQQIRTTFPTPSSITLGPLLTSCTYLRACIDEAMRLSPPVPSLLPREVLPGGMEIDGVYVAEGTVVGVSAYALHRNESYFPNALAYDPGRWLLNANPNPDDEKSLALAQSAFCPFSIGPRGCIGKGVAYLELSVALARVLWLYDMRLVESGESHGAGETGKGEYKLIDCFVAHKDGPVVEFKARGREMNKEGGTTKVERNSLGIQ